MKKTILFAGHMIDKMDRPLPRFPAKMEPAVKEELYQVILAEKINAGGEVIGLAGGACGGDILFHETCEELHIPTQMYLALPVGEFKRESVSFAGKDWEKRFDLLIKKIPYYVLGVKDTPSPQNVWDRTNNWLLETALENGEENMTLIVLWDGRKGDASGGTEHLVGVAASRGAKVITISTENLYSI